MKCIYKSWVSVTFSVVSDLGFDMLAVSKSADNLEDSLRAWLPSCLTYQEDAWGRYKYQKLKTQRKAYSKKETIYFYCHWLFLNHSLFTHLLNYFTVLAFGTVKLFEEWLWVFFLNIYNFSSECHRNRFKMK